MATFHVPESTSAEPFTFRIPGEKKDRTIPSLQALPIGIKHVLGKAAAPIERAKKAGKKPGTKEAQALGEAILHLFDTLAPGVTDALNERQLGALMRAWQEHSEIEVGES